MKVQFVIMSLLFELFLIISTGKAVSMGNYGVAASLALCALVMAIYYAAYIVVWFHRRRM